MMFLYLEVHLVNLGVTLVVQINVGQALNTFVNNHNIGIVWYVKSVLV